MRVKGLEFQNGHAIRLYFWHLFFTVPEEQHLGTLRNVADLLKTEGGPPIFYLHPSVMILSGGASIKIFGEAKEVRKNIKGGM